MGGLRGEQGGRVARVGAGHNREQRLEIACRSRDEADRLKIKRQRRKTVTSGNLPVRRPQAQKTRVTRRQARGAAGIGADREWNEPGGDRRGGAAARASWRERQVPGVLGRARKAALRSTGHGEFRRRGFAEDHQASVSQPLDAYVVALRNVVLVEQAPPTRGATGHEDVVLDRDRNAVELTAPLARLLARGRGIGLAENRLGIEIDEGVHGRVEASRSFEEMLRDGAGRDVPHSPFESRASSRPSATDWKYHHPPSSWTYANRATARIGPAVPPRIFSGNPIKRNRPRPTSLSRLVSPSMWVIPSSPQAL